MIECILAWVTLLIGMATQKAEWFIASGVFAVATRLYLMKQ